MGGAMLPSVLHANHAKIRARRLGGVNRMVSIRWMTAGVAFCLLCGCAKKDESERREAELEAATGSRTEIERNHSSETVTIGQGEARTTIATGVKLAAPANYPATGFIPNEADVRSSVTQGETVMIVYVAPGPLSDVFLRNREALLARGWIEDTLVQPHGGSAYASYWKNNSALSEEYSMKADGHVEVTQMYASGE